MAVTTTKTNKPINPRGNDQSPKGYNRAELYTGKALDFDGTNDNVNLDGFTMSGNTATISFYLKADDWDANSFIFGAGTPEIVIGSTTGGNNLSFYDSSSWKTFGTISDTTSTNFFSIVFDGTTAIAYMNGVKFGDTLTITAIDLSSVTGVRLMSKYTGGVFFFNGQLSGFKIFNTALTAAQISDLYNNPEKIVPTGVSNDALKLWLPMMEGAGTTAYDGSGNGNHGTISGATYVHGVGAPVAQSAVIDWNKGTNLLANSVGANKFVNSWAKSNTTINGDVTDPIGATDAIEVTMSNLGILYHTITAFTNGTGSIYMRSDTAGVQVQIGDPTGSPYETKTLTTDWVRYDYSDASSIGGLAIYNSVEGGTITIELAFPQVNAGATATPFVPTLSTAQTSPVLLPQGLTSGRDITGVNLFENVRKQGALNLDGNSWAEVHDNASLDITDAITLEAWVYWDTSILTGKGILGKWENSNQCYLLFKRNTGTEVQFYINGAYSVFDPMVDGWNHIVGTYDKVNRKLYINGELKDTDAFTASIATSALPVEIGRYNQSSAVAYDEDIAQPRIYNRALTAEEVERNYNAGKNTYKN